MLGFGGREGTKILIFRPRNGLEGVRSSMVTEKQVAKRLRNVILVKKRAIRPCPPGCRAWKKNRGDSMRNVEEGSLNHSAGGLVGLLLSLLLCLLVLYDAEH